MCLSFRWQEKIVGEKKWIAVYFSLYFMNRGLMLVIQSYISVLYTVLYTVLLYSLVSQRVPVNFLRMSEVFLFQLKQKKNRSRAIEKSLFISIWETSMDFISKSDWNPSCKANPPYDVLFSGCQRNKWSDGIWKDLTIRKVTFSLLSPPTTTAGKVMRARKDRAPAMVKLASLTNTIFYVFPWIMKKKRRVDVEVAVPMVCQGQHHIDASWSWELMLRVHVGASWRKRGEVCLS